MIKRLAFLPALLLTASAFAAEVEHAAQSADLQPHPTLPGHAHWAGVMLIVIFFMFLAALVIGPVVRLLAPPPLPNAPEPDDGHGAHAHDDHGHGHSHGH